MGHAGRRDDVRYLSQIILGRERSAFSGRWLIGHKETVQSEKGQDHARQYFGTGGQELESRDQNR